MKITEFVEGIHYVGVNDRKTTLFEGLWSLPYGVSYNSYLVVDDKIALVDPVEESYGDVLIGNIEEIIGDREIDYLVINHMEPDHSSAAKRLKARYPNIKVVGNVKTLDMFAGYYDLDIDTVQISEGEMISLGKRSLSFYMIPMVHWPETMVTYVKEEQVLFTGDALGTFGALNGGVVDHQLNLDLYWDEMRRYYSCIVGKYGVPVQNALKKLKGLDIKFACPSHGPIWNKEIGKVLDIYNQLSLYKGYEGMVVVYGSMYGNTEQLAEKIAREIAECYKHPIIVHNLSTADMSMVIRDIFKYDSLIVGCPTYNGNIYPPVAALLTALESRGIPHRNFACFGSFSWAGAAVKLLNAFAEKMKWNMTTVSLEMKRGYRATLNSSIREFVKEFVK